MRLSVILNEATSVTSLRVEMVEEAPPPSVFDLPWMHGADDPSSDANTTPLPDANGDTESSTAPPDAPTIPRFLDAMPTEPDSTDTPAADSTFEPRDTSRSGRQLLVDLVIVRVENLIRHDGPLPFTYEIIEAAPTTRRRSRAGSLQIELPVLRIIAAPGVYIGVVRATNANPQGAFYVDVIRVQDARILPELGEPIDIGLYLQNNGIPMRHDSDWGLEQLDLLRIVSPDEDEEGAFAQSNIAHSIRIHYRMAGARDHFEPETVDSRVTVIPTDDGTIFYDSLSKRLLQVKVPRFSRLGVSDSNNANAKYGYTINQWTLPEFTAVTIAATTEVEITQYCYVNGQAVVEADFNNDRETLSNLFNTALDARTLPNLETGRTTPRLGITGLSLEQIEINPFRLHRVPQIEAVPNPGERIIPIIDFGFPRPILDNRPTTVSPFTHDRFAYAPRRAPWQLNRTIPYEVPITLPRMLAEFGVDFSIGLIPVIGDLVDIADVLGAVLTGRDHWGNNVSNFELSLMALGAILPFVGNSSVRALGNGAMLGALVSGFIPDGDGADSELGLE